ncbi:MAG: hypothetical protein JSW39_20885 [Desulfobacterales bacterium]|nr:MAG: hypothetical protein JSW39_20885 [Desulfobacterales bacterium]
MKRLAQQIAHSFLDYYLKDCRYEEDFINLLCEMTTFAEDPALNHPGAHALFGIIIESLCDDFEEFQTVTYNRVMAQVVSFCRKIPDGQALDRGLQKFGIYTVTDLLDRITKIRADGNFLSPLTSVKKILLLSRVTIGADVAINSIIVQRLAQLFPEAAIVMIGSRRIQEVYGGNLRIKIREVSYSRQGGLLERLSSWHRVVQIIQQELTDCPLEETILIDPDSRLSQLGVLPLIARDRYFFFDSRSDAASSRQMSMSELTNAWLDKITGQEDFCYPQVWIPDSYLNLATRLCEGIRNYGARRIVAVNFGVGGNPRKRVGRHLEERLLAALLQQPQTVILLDKGLGAAERTNANELIAAIAAQGYAVQHTDFESNAHLDVKWGLVGLQSGIGGIAAVIARSDEFIGYDSAGQHIAAAIGTPCVTIFAGSNNMRFIRRWSAHGANPCHIVHVDTLTNPISIDVDNIINRVMNVRKLND